MRKRLTKLLVATVVVTSMHSVLGATPVYATPSINEIEEQIEHLDNTIQNDMIKIEQLNKDIEVKKAEISETEKDIEETEQELRDAQEAFDARVKGIYISGGMQTGTMAYIETILSSRSITDIFERVELIKKIIQSDQRIMQGVKDKQVELDSKKKSLEDGEKALEDSKATVDKELQEMNSAKLEQQKILAEQQALLTQQPSLMFAKQSIPANFTFSNDTSAKAKDIITEAQKYLGIPYVWGGTSPSGFDCSGLTQYVYAKYGVSLPRVAEDQQRAGLQVPITQMKPGDLVFWGYPAHHVGIYIGNGLYLHAPHTGDVVKISQLNPGNVTSVSRVIP